MRLSLHCELKENEIPLDYRRKIVSMFKRCLTNYDEDVFNKYYHMRDPIQKEFTFSNYFQNPIIKKETIEIPNKRIIINFSTSDNVIGIDFYNAFVKNLYQEIRFSTLNSIKITRIVIQKERKISSNRVVFRTQSPLIVRDHHPESGKDWYYSCNDLNFEKFLKRNLYNQLKDKFSENIEKDLDTLSIKKLDMKKIIVTSYGIKMASSIGSFEMEGEQYILNEVYQSGAGSKKSLGFSMVDIV
ncbi:CRISPR-associated endoribonuclease Cas6 [Sebaldella sp. S0638]|uniref:CRISPR-associated endoribonuclease Cas6 n=1 Tax=Sebaldella sp. S0638 TaxID=2957809 RepID=UPI00209E3702|nr:CRISPR-associated endoribonuclease Cas6 [Sebaldella sp. S0638]MCP1224810.1 CRISPR-associated endoribonuclease Cas6 [Sebaldella sp. S0638]